MGVYVSPCSLALVSPSAVSGKLVKVCALSTGERLRRSKPAQE